MEHYRLYFLDEEDHIRNVQPFDCGTDDGAIASVAARADGRAMELWRGAQVVAKFPKQEFKNGKK